MYGVTTARWSGRSLPGSRRTPQPVALLSGHACLPDPGLVIVRLGSAPAPVLRTSSATIWMWSSPCQIVTQRTALSSCLDGDNRCSASPRRRSAPTCHRTASCPRARPHRAVPDRTGKSPRSYRGRRLVQQPEQPPEVPAAIRPQRRLEIGGMPPPGDKVRIGMLLSPGTEQVVDQPLDPLSTRRGDEPRHSG